MNLLEATLSILNDNKKSPENVKWIGSNTVQLIRQHWSRENTFKINWDNYAFLAEKIPFDTSVESIPPFTVIVGDNWWLELENYDGSLEWKFQTIPEEPKQEFSWIDFLEIKC